MIRSLSLGVNNNKIVFACPLCKIKKKLGIGRLKIRPNNIVRIKCFCESIISVKLVFPTYHDEITQPSGHLFNLTRGSQQSRVTVTNKSSATIDLKVCGTNLPKKGDKVKVEYQDPQTRKTVLRHATVHRIHGKTVSCFITR